MRFFSIIAVLAVLVGPALAQDLGNRAPDTKDSSHLFRNPGTPDGRQGGEDMATAVVIDALPFDDTGNTTDNLDDYDAVCPYDTPGSPDVFYSFTPGMDIYVKVDLCGSGYDTKTYILDGNYNVIACNDDFYNDTECGIYVSMIEMAALDAGTEYFFVIDGYGGDNGDYILHVEEFIAPPPCILECPWGAHQEYEPPLEDGYIDTYNGGCFSPDESSFQYLGNVCGWPPDLNFCGKSGWFDDGSRDTDWFISTIGYGGTVTWTLDAEQEVYGFLLGPQDCDSVAVVDQMLAGPCEPATMVITGVPGETFWYWVGPSDYYPPAGFEGHEFDYQFLIDGIGWSFEITPTEAMSFDRLKSLYR